MKSKALNLLGFAAKAGKIGYGSESVKLGIKKNKVKLVLIAKDISEGSLKKIKFVCKNYDVRCIECFNREELSSAVGKNNKVVLGILDSSFADKIEEYCNM